MKKYLLYQSLPVRADRWAFIVRAMRITIFLTWVCVVNVYATGYSQDKLTLSLKNVKLSKVFHVIQQDTHYQFLYNDEEIEQAPPVSVVVKDATVPQILAICFTENYPLEYRIKDSTVVVLPRPKVPRNIQVPEQVSPPQFTVTGKVTDSLGNPLVGVSVSLKGTSTGTVTNVDGNYSLTLENGKGTIVFSYVGYKQREVPVNGKNIINATLSATTTGLDQLVVVGYGTQKKKDLTGAVSVVDVDAMVKQPVGKVTNQLQGRVSGVSILGSGQPGASPIIRIRGINTFGNNNPLFVVDGLPTTSIDGLNPDDIASMQVLKDASASIYGSRASNGVIIITTKKGNKGKVNVQYDAYYGTQIVRKGNVWNLNSPQEMANLKWLVYKNTNPNTPISDPLYGSGSKPILPDYIDPPGLFDGDPAVDPSLYNVDPYYTDPSQIQEFYRITRANKTGTDWFHEIFKDAPIMSHNLSVSGGNDNSKYFLSMNYFNQQGTLIYTYLKRYTLRANSQFNIHKDIKIGENISYSLIDNPKVSDLQEGSAIAMARRMQPIIPVHDIKGNFAGTSDGFLGVTDNPVAQQARTKNNKSLDGRLFGNVFLEINVLNDFTLRSSFGGSFSSGYSHSFTYPQYEGSENTTNNSYSVNSYSNYNWTWTNTLQYKKIFNDIHNLNILVGTESNKVYNKSISATTQGYYSFDPDYTNLTTGAGAQLHNSSKYLTALFSYIGRLEYGYDNKYLLNATIRRDGSSRFISEKFGWFPSISVAWRISQEEFMQSSSLNWISDLKIRASYGVLGNQINIDPANGYTTYGSDRDLSSYDITGSGNTLEEGFMKNRIGNPDARWEKDFSSNIGLDATLFNGKLNLSIDYYRKRIEDLLFNPIILGTAGQATRPFVNIGKMENKGVDILASTSVDISHKLKLNATLTFTSYNNKILKVSNTSNHFDQDSRRFNGSFIVRNQVGHPVGAFFGYKIAGFWDSQDEIDQANAGVKTDENPTAIYQNDMGVGRFRYADTNGDGQITAEDRTFLGNPNPEFTYGLNIGLNYKRFDFSVFLYGVYGNDIWNNVLWWTDFYSSFNSAKSHTALYDSWTPNNHNAKAPIQEFTGSFSTANVPNSYFVEKGSYLRAKNAQLGYSFSSELLDRVKIERLRVYFQTANLFTITNYGGVDPEISGSTTDFGVDEGAYPNPKQFLIGLNVTF